MNSAKDKMGSARGYMSPGTAKVTQAASRGWDTTIALVMPLADAARQGSVRATSMPNGLKKKTASSTGNGGHMATTMVSIVAAGAAIGATGALVARRRNRSKWAEYEPSALQDDAQAFVDESRSEGRDRPHAASKMAGWAKEHGRSAMGGVRGKMHDSSAGAAGRMDEMTSRPSGMGGDMSESTPDVQDRPGDTGHHMADKADAKLNDASPLRGSKSAGKSGDVTDDVTDDADEFLRSSKNEREQ
jgi:hypothetical protein